MPRSSFISFLILLSLALVPASPAQAPPPPETNEDALHAMSDEAGVIFVGEVISIRQKPGRGGGTGWVEINFRVDQAVRGSNAGDTYTLREWAGLWEGGEERYRPGQLLLMLL